MDFSDRITLEISPKPSSSFTAYCEAKGDCAFQYHTEDYLDDVSCHLHCFSAREGDSRMRNTFPMRVIFYPIDEMSFISISDDDDTCIGLWKKNSSLEEAQSAWRWLKNLSFVNPWKIIDRFEQLDWTF